MSAPDENELTEQDQQTLNLLETALASLPLPDHPSSERAPDSVLDGAMWIHDWINMDADLAELTFDSASSPLTSVRSAGSLRQLTFISGESEIQLEIEPQERSVTVSGTIAPVVSGRLQLVVGGQVYRGEIDSLGTFIVEGVRAGTVLAFMEIDGSNVRLGSFEV
ncbi:MAG: hypothetical protein ACR2QK_08285 [Acidimicrobiales bacterium]